MTGSRPARRGRGTPPLGAAVAFGAEGAPPRRRRLRLFRRGCSLAFLLVALPVAGALLGIATHRSPLPVPEEFLPAHGSITAIEVPRGAVRELDGAIRAFRGQLPATLSFAGNPIEVPAAYFAVAEWSGPWRVALWREPAAAGRGGAEGRFVLFIGGEALGPARGALAREAARRLDGRDGLAATAGGGGLLLGDDSELVRECAGRAERATRRPIPRHGVRFWRDDAERGAALELWWEPAAGEDHLLERWRGDGVELDWRDWLLDHGVEVTPLEGETVTPGERRYRLRGARVALSELADSFRRW